MAAGGGRRQGEWQLTPAPHEVSRGYWAGAATHPSCAIVHHGHSHCTNDMAQVYTGVGMVCCSTYPLCTYATSVQGLLVVCG